MVVDDGNSSNNYTVLTLPGSSLNPFQVHLIYNSLTYNSYGTLNSLGIDTHQVHCTDGDRGKEKVK